MSEVDEVPDFALSYGNCFWFLEEQDRPCAATAHHRRGRMVFCTAHDKKFVTSVLQELARDVRFRDQVIREMQAHDTDEAELWIAHRRKIKGWSPGTGRAHCVYFAAREGFVKIGRTANITKRIHDIGKGSCMPQGMSVGPVNLLATILCDCRERGCVRERHFHERFVDKWLEGEWFIFDAELAAFVGSLKECAENRLREISFPAPEVSAA